jgi:DnaK suppressor protein
MDREVDLGLTDRDTVELGAVSRALLKLRQGGYRRCEACGADIPFDRLKVEPEATRCMPCESAAERR